MNGKGICAHDRRKNWCKKCKWAAICEHVRNKHYYKKCGDGKGLCKTPHCPRVKKVANETMDSVEIALLICFRMHLLHGTI